MAERAKNASKTEKMQKVKQEMQNQMFQKEEQRQEAYQLYLAERDQVDGHVKVMIQEDIQTMEMIQAKKDQFQKDMVLSQEEKASQRRRAQELHDYEEEIVRRHNQNQQKRMHELQAMKAAVEGQRDEIFRRLCEEEAERRAQAEYVENLRNELSAHGAEERARQQERDEQAKRDRQRAELQAAADYAQRVKAARLEQEKRDEDVFKAKLGAKFAEDERIEQLNANQRRMKEQEHKREIEKIWSDRVTRYREERQLEWQQKEQEIEQKTAYQAAVTEYKQNLLEEHMALLKQYNPKAASVHSGSVQGGQSQNAGASALPKGSIK